METDIQEQEFNGNPESCAISQSSLDISSLDLKANDCLTNAFKVAQKYNFCEIVEGVLCSKDCVDGGMCFVRHAWNYDTRNHIYFDETVKLDEAKNNIVGKIDYQYYKCFEYTPDYALKNIKSEGFQYSYKDLILFMKSKVVSQYFRPEWTIGRYNAEKHVALMYNLIAGFSYFFENQSADVIGEILKVGRNGKVNIHKVANSTGIHEESIQSFFNLLIQHGLLVNSIPTKDGIKEYRKQLAAIRLSQPSWVDRTTEEKLPMETSNAEQQYFDALDNGKTICSCMFELTYRCSEMCIHCYNPGATRNNQEVSHRGDVHELNLSDYKHIIDEMRGLGLVKVCLTGGDPFSKEFTWELLDYLYEKEIAVDIFTNGQRITKDIQRLADYYPRLVGISIYSGIAEDHDAITRIPGSWNRSMQVVKELSELAVPMNLKCCIMQPNLHTYYMVADLARQYGAKPQFEINITESNDGDICAKQLRLTEEQLQIVLRDNNLALYVGKEAPNYGGVKRDLSLCSCGAGRTGFCLSPNGDMRACVAFTQVYGNLRMQTALDILNNSKTLQDWRNAVVADYEECGKHSYCDYCNLCAGVNYTEHRDFRKPAETNCHMAKCRYNLAQKLMNNYKELTREQFVEALRRLPKGKMNLERRYHTKG